MVVFDLDGVLIDSMESTLACIRFLHGMLGLSEPTDAQLGNVVSRQNQKSILLAVLEERTSTPTAYIDDILRWADHIYPYHFAALAKSIDGVVETVHHIKNEGLTVAILSNNTRETSCKFVKDHGLTQLVDKIMAGEDVTTKEEALALLARQAAVKRSQMIYVGDTLEDMKACNEIGARGIAVLSGFGKESELRKLTRDVVPDVTYVPDLILSD
jgi:phosphoglycolate phosphatase